MFILIKHFYFGVLQPDKLIAIRRIQRPVKHALTVCQLRLGRLQHVNHWFVIRPVFKLERLNILEEKHKLTWHELGHLIDHFRMRLQVCDLLEHTVPSLHILRPRQIACCKVSQQIHHRLAVISSGGHFAFVHIEGTVAQRANEVLVWTARDMQACFIINISLWEAIIDDVEVFWKLILTDNEIVRFDISVDVFAIVEELKQLDHVNAKC